MAKMTHNREGLTFEEWVCAAGVAIFTGSGEVIPYTKSDSRHTMLDGSLPIEREKSIFKEASSFYWHKGYRVAVKKRTTTFYSKKIRDAWKRGEDPCEWRA